MSTNKHYFGLVVNNNDPWKLGRCQVRLIGLYDSFTTADLPWIQMMLPINHHVIQPPEIGRQVVCMSLDDHNQHMLMVGIVPGVNDSDDTPDTPALARNDPDDKPAIITKLNDSLVGGLGLEQFGSLVASVAGIDFSTSKAAFTTTRDVMAGNWAGALTDSGSTDAILGEIKGWSDEKMIPLKDQLGDIFPPSATEEQKNDLLKGTLVYVDNSPIEPDEYMLAGAEGFKKASNATGTGNNIILPVGVILSFAKDVLALINDPSSVLSNPLVMKMTEKGLSYLQSPAAAASTVASISAFATKEPEIPINTVYPYGKVEETSSWYKISDSTPGSGLEMTVNNNGSYQYISEGGVVTIKSIADTYNINNANRSSITQGNDSEMAGSKTSMITGLHSETAVVRNIFAGSGHCNMPCPFTGLPFHVFGAPTPA
jgi:hypothetical protein